MKTKYTLQELKDKDIAIKCDTQSDLDRVIKTLDIIIEGRYGTKNGCLYNVIKFWKGDFNPLFVWEELANNRTIIPASEFFLEDEPTPEVKPVLDHIESLPMPSVIEIATTEFDLFLKEWNGLHKKAMKIKSINALRNLTKKIKEL